MLLWSLRRVNGLLLVHKLSSRNLGCQLGRVIVPLLPQRKIFCLIGLFRLHLMFRRNLFECDGRFIRFSLSELRRKLLLRERGLRLHRLSLRSIVVGRLVFV